MIKENNSPYRWIIWCSLCSAFLIVFIQRYAIAVVVNDLSGELKLTGLQLSSLSSMYFYAYAFMQIPVGIMADTFGPRKVTSLGMLVAGAGSILFSISQSITVIFLSRLLIGIGVSTIFVSIFKILTVWFPPNKFATLTGWTSVIGNIGGMLATTPLALLVTFIGWRDSFTSIGIASLFIAVLLWLVVRDKPSGSQPVNLTTSDPAKSEDLNIFYGLKLILLNPQMWINFFIVFGVMGTIMSFSGLWGVPYLTHVYQMSKSTGASYILIFTLGVTIGSIFLGTAERVFTFRKRVVQIIAMIFTLLWGALIFFFKCTPVTWLIPIIFFTMGFSGIMVMLLFVNAKEMNPPQYSGLVTGFINFAPFIGAAFLNTLIGFVLDISWNGLIINGARIYSAVGYQKGLSVYLFFSGLALMLSLIFLKDSRE
ncbi:MAG: MFS transporter [Bacillota bacterium]